MSAEDKRQLQHDGVNDMSPRINNFADTAAIIHHMDLIVTIDTSVAHMSGAMAKPVINLLPFINDWRWQEEREDSPWYPDMRLYRQVCHSNWEEVIERVQTTLQALSSDYENKGKIHTFRH